MVPSAIGSGRAVGDIEMEQYNSFVSSRGLLTICDIRNTEPRSSLPIIDFSVHNRLRHGSSIYVCQDAIGLFATHILGSINIPFVLVSGDSDLPLTRDVQGFEEILKSEHLIAWYAQNLKVTSKKLHHLPIGLDYHTAWKVKGHYEAVEINPIQQELTLRSTLRSSKRSDQRTPRAYCNWHFAMRGNREECLGRANALACYYPMVRVPRTVAWKEQSDFMFTLSPEGAGMDCHRTWEAILLGSIPIVNRNCISPLFDQLPVLIVDDWIEVTQQFLQDSFDQMIGQTYNFSSLFLHYWKSRFIGTTIDRTFENLTIDQFRNLIS
jgi:hypothetical protein